jgi:hypothetical protein
MSNKTNPRRQRGKRTETGPRYESHNPGEGCNSTHVARSRKKWKRRASRTERRNGVMSPKVFFKNTKKNSVKE